MKSPQLPALILGLFLSHFTPCLCEANDLYGKWQIVSMPEGWKKIPGVEVLVADGHIQIRCGSVVTSRLRYTADASKGTIDAIKTGERKAEIQRGIYRMVGNTITISIGPRGKSRPASPDSTEGGALKWVLRRVGRE